VSDDSVRGAGGQIKVTLFCASVIVAIKPAVVMAYTANLLLRTLPAIYAEENAEQETWPQLIIDAPRPNRDDGPMVIPDLPRPDCEDDVPVTTS